MVVLIATHTVASVPSCCRFRHRLMKSRARLVGKPATAGVHYSADTRGPARITGISCEMRERTVGLIDRHLSSGEGHAERLRTRQWWINSAQAVVSVCQARSQERS
jgi:hypothetical protein